MNFNSQLFYLTNIITGSFRHDRKHMHTIWHRLITCTSSDRTIITTTGTFFVISPYENKFRIAMSIVTSLQSDSVKNSFSTLCEAIYNYADYQERFLTFSVRSLLSSLTLYLKAKVEVFCIYLITQFGMKFYIISLFVNYIHSLSNDSALASNIHRNWKLKISFNSVGYDE